MTTTERPRDADAAADYLERAARLHWDEAALRHAADVMQAMGRAYLDHVATGLRSVHVAFHRMGWALTDKADYRRHRRRCRTCNPAGFARPLPINAHEYRRRRRARRRRARR